MAKTTLTPVTVTTAMIAYLLIGKLFDWPQTSKETK